MSQDKEVSDKLNFNISKDLLEKTIAEIIIETSLGDRIKEAIDKSINNTSSSSNFGYRSLIQQSVDRLVMDVAVKEAHNLIEPLRPKIKELITEQLTEETISKIISKMFENLDKIR